MKSRRLVGLLAAAVCLYGIVATVQSVHDSLSTFSDGGPPWHILGAIGPVVLLVLTVALTAGIAYRNLFWSRYVAGIRARMERRYANAERTEHDPASNRSRK